jgi:outer membrane protein assembly factor BamB
MWRKHSLFVAALAITHGAAAGDWPQILGPSRNGVATGERLVEKWPASGPKVLWRYKLGSGYAGPAVAQGRVVVFHRVGNSERVECLDAASGKSVWKADFAATYRGGVDPDTGPRCVPLISGDTAYVFGAAGDLHAVDFATGNKRWSRALYEDYGGDEGYFGAGSTPLLLSNRLMVNVGGRGAGLVALDPANGKTLWKTTDEAASYSSPTAAKIGPQVEALFITRMNCVLANPNSGQTKTLFAFGKRGPTVNAATPLVLDGQVFATASYGVGAELAPLSGQTSRPVWSSDDVLSSQYTTPVYYKGFLYGNHGREDVGVAELRCVEAATGKVRWKQPDYGVAHLILAGDKLLIQHADGRLALALATPDKYQQLASATITREPTRALPALANGRLFVRTGSGGGELICLELGKRPEG